MYTFHLIYYFVLWPTTHLNGRSIQLGFVSIVLGLRRDKEHTLMYALQSAPFL